MGALIIHKVEWNGKLLDINAVAKLTNRTYSNISYYVSKRGITTKDALLAEIKKTEAKNGVRVESKKHKFLLGEFSVTELWKIHPFKSEVSEQMIRGRMKKYGSMSLVILYKRYTQAEMKAKMIADGIWEDKMEPSAEKMPKIQVEIDKKHCLKDWNTCAHYSSCTDSICFEQKLHPRCKPDYSCYRSPKSYHTNSNHGESVPNYSSRTYGGFSE